MNMGEKTTSEKETKVKLYITTEVKKLIGMTTNRKAMVQERNGSGNTVQWLRELRQADTRKGTSKTTTQSK